MRVIGGDAKFQKENDKNWDQYRFLFWSGNEHLKFALIHVPRCGGTSMEIALRGNLTGKMCGPPPRTPEEKKRCLTSRGVVIDPYDPTYFKFAFVRNPWDRLVSAYYQFLANSGRTGAELAFEKFVEEIVLPGDHMQKWADNKKATYDHWFSFEYFIGPYDNLYTDFIGRFENLQADWEIAVEKMGLQPIQLGWVDKTKSKPRYKDKVKRNAYQTYYTEQLKNDVGDFYARDIAHFNYDF